MLGSLALDWFTLEALLRLVLAVVVGAMVGMERERGNRPAGLRTHTLVCLGACAVMVASLWFAQRTGFEHDPMRMSAQVISGIGFLGAGTIIKSEAGVRGLTTAASLWVVACIGLVIGMGFYIGGLMAAVLTYAALALFKRMEERMESRSRQLYLRMCESADVVGTVLQAVEAAGGNVTRFSAEKENGLVHISLNVRMKKGDEIKAVVDALVGLDGLLMVKD